MEYVKSFVPFGICLIGLLMTGWRIFWVGIILVLIFPVLGEIRSFIMEVTGLGGKKK